MMNVRGVIDQPNHPIDSFTRATLSEFSANVVDSMKSIKLRCCSVLAIEMRWFSGSRSIQIYVRRQFTRPIQIFIRLSFMIFIKTPYKMYNLAVYSVPFRLLCCLRNNWYHRLNARFVLGWIASALGQYPILISSMRKSISQLSPIISNGCKCKKNNNHDKHVGEER